MIIPLKSYWDSFCSGFHRIFLLSLWFAWCELHFNPNIRYFLSIFYNWLNIWLWIFGLNFFKTIYIRYILIIFTSFYIVFFLNKDLTFDFQKIFFVSCCSLTSQLTLMFHSSYVIATIYVQCTYLCLRKIMTQVFCVYKSDQKNEYARTTTKFWF